jgi:hypothetical protein
VIDALHDALRKEQDLERRLIAAKGALVEVADLVGEQRTHLAERHVDEFSLAELDSELGYKSLVCVLGGGGGAGHTAAARAAIPQDWDRSGGRCPAVAGGGLHRQPRGQADHRRWRGQQRAGGIGVETGAGRSARHTQCLLFRLGLLSSSVGSQAFVADILGADNIAHRAPTTWAQSTVPSAA